MIASLLWLRNNWKLIAIASSIVVAFGTGWHVKGRMVMADAAERMESERAVLLAHIRGLNTRQARQAREAAARERALAEDLAAVEATADSLGERIEAARLGGAFTHDTTVDTPDGPRTCPDPTASRAFWELINEAAAPQGDRNDEERHDGP